MSPASSGASCASAGRRRDQHLRQRRDDGQFLTDNLNGGDNQNMPGAAHPFLFLAQAGNEYDNAKLVYLSPQIAGFDFGIQCAPNTSNGNGIGGRQRP